MDVGRTTGARRESEIDLILTLENVVHQIHESLEPQFAVEVDAHHLLIGIPRYAALMVFAVFYVRTEGIGLHGSCNGGAGRVVHTAIGYHGNVVPYGVTILSVLPGVEFYGEGRLEVIPKEAESTATLPDDRGAHRLHDEADAICPSGIRTTEVDQELQVERLVEVHLVCIPDAPRVVVQCGRQLVAVLTRHDGIPIEVVHRVILRHDRAPKPECQQHRDRQPHAD